MDGRGLGFSSGQIVFSVRIRTRNKKVVVGIITSKLPEFVTGETLPDAV
jgi:hypothetical protein